jgi:peptidoglycan/xylan/chitin deacetylase (PgdA/CDA1 family)
VRALARAEIVNICFHGIGTPGPDIEAEARGYFISNDLFLEVLDEACEHPSVELSFDDGYASDAALALPALVERGLSAWFFPLAGHLGKRGYLGADEVRELATAGMRVGSHGMRHRSWRRMDPASQHEELVEARQIIGAAAGAPVETAACPFGDYDRGVLAALRQHRYITVFTSDRQRARAGAWLQPRYSIRQGDTVQVLRDGILAARPIPERARGAVTARLKSLR